MPSVRDPPVLQKAMTSWRETRRSASADEFVETYVCWREACEDVRRAYGRWMNCEPRERGLRFAAYSAALEREEHASGIHSDWAERLGALAR